MRKEPPAKEDLDTRKGDYEDDSRDDTKVRRMTVHHPQEVARLEASERDRAAATLSRAFRDDPVQRYVMPDDTRRARGLSWTFGALVRYCLPYGEVYATTDLGGVACWLPPGAGTANVWGMIRSGMILAPLRLGPAAFARFVRLSAYLDATRERVVPVPHWYLLAIGVEPSRQGEGIGGALLEPVIAQADASGLPCYLETQTERNVKFYEKHGFAVANVGKPRGVRGLRVWAMLRTPRGPKTAPETQPEPSERSTHER